MSLKVNNRYRYYAGVVYITLFATEEKILAINLDNSKKVKLEGIFLTKSNKLIENAISQLDAFFKRQINKIQLPLEDYADENEKKVYEEIKKVKYGETISLEKLVKNLKMDKELVIKAIKNNRYPIIVPSHRVIDEKNELECNEMCKEANKSLREFESK